LDQVDRLCRRIKLPHLNILLAVAETGSMAKAAKHLATSQSVVSKSIGELEDTLGVVLFDRTPQGVEATIYGKALLRRSVALLDDLKTTVAEIKFLSDPSAGELRIGCTEPQAEVARSAIERLTQQYPRLAFNVVIADAATLIERYVRERQIELAITPLPRPERDFGLEATMLYQNRLRIVVSRRSRWAHRRKISLENLMDEPWCAPLDGPAGSLITQAFHASGLSVPRMTLSTISDRLIIGMLSAGRFVAVLGDGVVYFAPERSSLKVLPVEFPAQPVPIGIVTLKNRTSSPVAKLFIDCACSVVRPLLEAQ
jgi:DNA-binding transcriptional LysR family regulator